MSVLTDLQSLYEIDSYQWLEETIKLLKSKHLDALDLEHLIEELEDLGRSERNAVESLLEQIIRHLRAIIKLNMATMTGEFEFSPS